MTGTARTLYRKIWDSHVVTALDEKSVLLYIDLHLLNEVTSPQAFDGLRAAGQRVRRPDRTLAVADHNVPTTGRSCGIAGITDPQSRLQVETLEHNVAQHGIPYVPLLSRDQGIVHVIGPELGLTHPGSTVVCGDSHTSTHGAFGALAFGIGTSEAEHVLATQTLVQEPMRSMLVQIDGALPPLVTAKDMALKIIAAIGANGASGHVIEYAGPAVRSLDMAGRMTLCNMSIEAGAKAGLIAPDEKTFAWLRENGSPPDEAVEARWRTLCSDEGASFDRIVRLDVGDARPMTTWGTSPDTAIAVDEAIPVPTSIADPGKRAQAEAMLRYMGLTGGQAIAGTPIDVVFIGSCTNGRIEDLRAAATILAGRRVSGHVRALVVPGSGRVKGMAEAEGLDRIFKEAGFEWRDPGCSMCLGMNPDRLEPGQRCASTSNRNFEGRQGPGGRTHLMSPAMAAAAAVAGRIVDVREMAG